MISYFGEICFFSIPFLIYSLEASTILEAITLFFSIRSPRKLIPCCSKRLSKDPEFTVFWSLETDLNMHAASSYLILGSIFLMASKKC